MRRSLFLATALLTVLIVDAAAAPPPAQARQFPPQDTLQQLKVAFARGDKGEEWRTLSPGFKARLSQRAGRNVDVGDYISARNAYRNDPRIKELEQWIHTASMTRFHQFGNGTARATIRFGAPLLVGKEINVTMINHGLWRLVVRGEPEPYWGFVGDRRTEVEQQRDGSVTVITRDTRGRVVLQNNYKPGQFQYSRFNKWFFHGFGEMEAEFMRGIGATGDGTPQPRAAR